MVADDYYVIEGKYMVATEHTVAKLCKLPYDVTIARRARMTADELTAAVIAQASSFHFPVGERGKKIYKSLMLVVLALRYAEEYRIEME